MIFAVHLQRSSGTGLSYSAYYMHPVLNYKCYYTTLHIVLHIIILNYKQNYAHTHNIRKVSLTQSWYIDIAMYKLHTKLIWCVLETSILPVVLTYCLYLAIVISYMYYMNITTLIMNLSFMLCKCMISYQGSDVGCWDKYLYYYYHYYTYDNTWVAYYNYKYVGILEYLYPLVW